MTARSCSYSYSQERWIGSDCLVGCERGREWSQVIISISFRFLKSPSPASVFVDALALRASATRGRE